MDNIRAEFLAGPRNGSVDADAAAIASSAKLAFVGVAKMSKRKKPAGKRRVCVVLLAYHNIFLSPHVVRGFVL